MSNGALLGGGCQVVTEPLHSRACKQLRSAGRCASAGGGQFHDVRNCTCLAAVVLQGAAHRPGRRALPVNHPDGRHAVSGRQQLPSCVASGWLAGQQQQQQRLPTLCQAVLCAGRFDSLGWQSYVDAAHSAFTPQQQLHQW
jgi:hypothetical protein